MIEQNTLHILADVRVFVSNVEELSILYYIHIYLKIKVFFLNMKAFLYNTYLTNEILYCSIE